MTTEGLLRGLAAVAALVVGRRERWGAAAAGVLAGFAVFGASARAFPGPATAALLLAILTGFLLVVFSAIWPPILGEAVLDGVLLAVPSALFAAVALRRQPAPLLLAGTFGVLAAVSVFAVLGTLASAESGWRKPALWTASVVAAAGIAGAAAELTGTPSRRGVLAAFAGVAAVLAWLPAILVERSRVKAELSEEVLLGLLPEEDAVVLQLPWTRALEKRFGRADERHEYVRSALLLAVARQQQRRRSGDAERLRQLEVITFRTRIRRTLDARAGRYQRSESAELASFEIEPGEEGARGNPIGVPPENQ
jgi:hypothetical protein